MNYTLIIARVASCCRHRLGDARVDVEEGKWRIMSTNKEERRAFKMPSELPPFVYALPLNREAEPFFADDSRDAEVRSFKLSAEVSREKCERDILMFVLRVSALMVSQRERVDVDAEIRLVSDQRKKQNADSQRQHTTR
jgi:hypothetical protein